jgi:hypothetical protein
MLRPRQDRRPATRATSNHAVARCRSYALQSTIGAHRRFDALQLQCELLTDADRLHAYSSPRAGQIFVSINARRSSKLAQSQRPIFAVKLPVRIPPVA